jgi:hypothetical protein
MKYLKNYKKIYNDIIYFYMFLYFIFFVFYLYIFFYHQYLIFIIDKIIIKNNIILFL